MAFLRNILFITLLTSAVSSWAGVTFTAVTHTSIGGQPNPAADVTVKAWVDGKNARMEFVHSEMPVLESGTYMVSQDTGKTVYFVDPAHKRFARWDEPGMMSGMADLMRSMRGEMRVRFEEPQIEKLLEEDGGTVAGWPTRHYRYRTSYRALIEMSGEHTIATVVEEDIWSTSKLDEPGLATWLRKDPAPSGDAQLDQIIKAEMNKIVGFPLRRVTVTKTLDQNGRESETKTEMLVKEMKHVGPNAASFTVPSAYHEIDMSEVEQPDSDSLRKMIEEIEKQKKQ